MSLFCALQKAIPQHLLSKAIGTLAQSEIVFIKNIFIQLFRKAYGIHLNEAEIKNFSEFKSFNDFFTRALESDARPITSDSSSIISPADGKVSASGAIDGVRIFQAKKHDYRLDELLPVAQADWSPFIGGQFATIYLAPNDYHRVHMPCNARLTKTVYVPGDLFSVNNTTAENIPRLFARNERLVAFFETDFGPMAMVLVGALIVAGIETVFHGFYKANKGELLWNENPLGKDGKPLKFKAGDEFGRFLLGSTVVLLMPAEAPQGQKLELNLESGQVVRCRQTIGSWQ